MDLTNTEMMKSEDYYTENIDQIIHDNIPCDDETLQDCRDMLALQGAVKASQMDENTADIAWEKFNKRISPRWSLLTFISYHSVAVAASLVLLLAGVAMVWQSYSNNVHLVAYERDTIQHQLVLTTAQGDVLLDEKKRIDDASSMPKLYRNQNQMVLDYHASSLAEYSSSDRIETHSVTIPRGKDFKVVLDDGTEVYLYADSRLTYPVKFKGEERHVALRGEAYFKVTKDARHPFIIDMEDGSQACVLGTELNVSSYADRPGHIALITGSVKVQSPGGASSCILQPGQGADITGAQISVAEENMDVYTYWLEGFMYFDEVPLKEVAAKLGRWYNVNVTIRNEAIANKNVRFYCERSESIERCVELLNSLKVFKAKYRNNSIVIE